MDQEGLRIQTKGSELHHGQSREQRKGKKYRVFFLLRSPVFNLRRNLLDCNRRHSCRIYHRHNNSYSIHRSASVGCKANRTVVLTTFLMPEENIPRDPVFIWGLVTLVSSPRIPGRLAGVSIVESGVATSEITLLSLTAFYEHITVSAFVAGMGVSSFVGPLYYTSKYVSYSRSLMLRKRLHERGFKSSRFHTLETASRMVRFQSFYTVPISLFSSTYLRYVDLVPRHSFLRKGIWVRLLRRHFVSVNMAKNSAQFT